MNIILTKFRDVFELDIDREELFEEGYRILTLHFSGVAFDNRFLL